MKVLVLTIGLFLAAAHGMPYGGDPEFAMVPDEDGWKLVNLNAEPELETFYNPETDIIFTLFTNANRQGQVIRWNDPSWIAGSGFNPNNPTRVTIHGWNGGANSRVNTAVHASLFQRGQFNCITVDWAAGAGTNNYISARNRVGPTGHVVGALLRMLNEQTGLNLRQVSVIGHSLGAHVSGFTGKFLNSNLGSIVALDAAFPLFNINSPDARVAIGDADYVESIHTNTGLLGFDEPLGHANFYPNFGRRQPGCGVDVSGNCAHARAHEFFAESIITQVGFWARRCRNYQDIVNENCVASGEPSAMGGEPLSSNAEGVFWLTTNSASPFAVGRQ